MKFVVPILACFVCFAIGFFTGMSVNRVNGAYPVKIVSINHMRPIADGTFFNADLVFDRTVPNGSGILVIENKGKKFSMNLWSINEELGTSVDRLSVFWNPKEREPQDFLKGNARFYSHDYPPELRK